MTDCISRRAGEQHAEPCGRHLYRGHCFPSGMRNLLDLFKVAIDPQNGKAAIIYTDDTITETSSGAPLPQVVLAQQN